ncbi:hypothetical protein RRF57_011064 [Xylaria bambusicola]|uniref:Uncharacterized protein n=1 Tax=Xylaria bambusicola TaxID=326684 RepID=A0AAN7UU81_9PEZI
MTGELAFDLPHELEVRPNGNDTWNRKRCSELIGRNECFVAAVELGCCDSIGCELGIDFATVVEVQVGIFETDGSRVTKRRDQGEAKAGVKFDVCRRPDIQFSRHSCASGPDWTSLNDFVKENNREVISVTVRDDWDIGHTVDETLEPRDNVASKPPPVQLVIREHTSPMVSQILPPCVLKPSPMITVEHV